MAQITLKGNPVHTHGTLPGVGSAAPGFELVANDLSSVSLNDFAGKPVILNIFPSVDTGTCATSVRTFNERAAAHGDIAILCVSMDLPFAQTRFCGAEGIERVQTLSAFRNSSFGTAYGVTLTDGPLAGLFARAVVVIGADGTVQHQQLVGEIAEEPDYDAALAVL